MKKIDNSLEENKYVIQYPVFLKGIMIAGFMFFLIFFLIGLGTYIGIWDIFVGVDLGTVIFYGCVVLFYLTCVGGVVVWRIIIDKEDIFYRNYFGITRKYKFTEIDRVIEKENGKLLVYKNGRRIFSIDNNLPEGFYLWRFANEYKIEICSEITTALKQKSFIVRPAKYHKALCDISLGVFVFFLCWCVVVKYMIGIIVFVCFTLYGIFASLYHHSEKYIIGNGYIERNNIFKKKKCIAYSEVSKVEKEEAGNVSYLVFYQKGSEKSAMKINTYYENAHALEELAGKKKWIR